MVVNRMLSTFVNITTHNTTRENILKRSLTSVTFHVETPKVKTTWALKKLLRALHHALLVRVWRRVFFDWRTQFYVENFVISELSSEQDVMCNSIWGHAVPLKRQQNEKTALSQPFIQRFDCRSDFNVDLCSALVAVNISTNKYNNDERFLEFFNEILRKPDFLRSDAT